MAAQPSTLARSPRTAAGGRPNLRVVAAPRHGRRYTLLMILLGAVAVFGSVAVNALAAEHAFTARTLEAEVSDLEMRYDELTVEVAGLESPKRIRRVASQRLGMVPARRPAFVVLGGTTADPWPRARTVSSSSPGG